MFKGDNINIMLFGESHGTCVGVCIEGLPHGIKIDMDKINLFMEKRKGRKELSTPRREKDSIKIMSGVFNGYTTGGAICALIDNEDTRSIDYTPNLPRPSHADYTANGRYKGFQDYRGGGMFSGRLTAPLVFVGAIADSILENKGVSIGTHVVSIHNVCDIPLDFVKIDKDTIDALNSLDIPLCDLSVLPKIEEAIKSAKDNKDSVGGVIECVAINYPAFIGQNYFNRINSKIAGLVFSIPAICAMEFGGGFDLAKHTGSQVNDSLYTDGKNVFTSTNNSGGINGGITNGMPIVIRCAIRPTPSISQVQSTIDIDKMENTKIAVTGRHDPCIALRATIVLKSMMAIALLDELL